MTRLTFESVRQYVEEIDGGYDCIILTRCTNGYNLFTQVDEFRHDDKFSTLKGVMEWFTLQEKIADIEQQDDIDMVEANFPNEDLGGNAYFGWSTVEPTPKLFLTRVEDVEANYLPQDRIDPWSDGTKESYNGSIDMLLLAFNIKLTATVLELYSAEISKFHTQKGEYFESGGCDELGTSAMHLGFDANTLFLNACYVYADDMPEWWFDALLSIA